MSRAKHDRYGDVHEGTLPATLVELAEAIGVHGAGADIETLLRALHDEIVDLEWGRRRNGRFAARSIIGKTQVKSFWMQSRISEYKQWLMNAVLFNSMSSSYSVDATIGTVYLIALDALIQTVRFNQFALDSELQAAIVYAQVAQMTVEVLRELDSESQVAQLAVEVLRELDSSANVAQLAVEVLREGNNAQLAQLAIEVLREGRNARLAQLTGEALVNESSPTSRTAQFAVEVLRAKV